MSKKAVLEWVANNPGTFAGGATTEEETDRLELGLRDDEIAEIHKIVLDINLVEDFDAAKTVALYAWISMDPDSAYGVNINRDLETIVSTQYSKTAEGILAGTETVIDNEKTLNYDFDPPVLVGTDLGMGLYGLASVGNLDAGSTAFFRVFFTRRKATAAELNRILLKRR